MVRHYQRMKCQKYTSEQLLAAIRSIKEHGMKVAVAAEKYHVPLSTLYDHIKERVIKIGAGAPTVLTKEEEKEIVITLQVLQEMGFELTKELVGIVICDYLNDQPGHPNPFSSGVPGEDWWQRFHKRWHSELSVRKPQHLPTHRALSATPEVIYGWFECVQQLFDETKLSTLPTDELKCYLWNCDETGFCTAMTAKKIFNSEASGTLLY